MAEDSTEDFVHPFGVVSDEEGDLVVKVTVVVPGLKKKMFKDEASNGTVELKMGPRSMDVRIHMSKTVGGKAKVDKFRYNVKRLPEEVLPSKCYHKVKKDKVLVYLQKAEQISWQATLAEGGLETCEDQEDEVKAE